MVSFPLLLIPLAIYNIIVWLMPGVSFADPLVKLTLVSGEPWQITLSDILLAVSMLLLLLEVIKGARPGARYLTDHLLSFIVFGAAAAEFVLWPKFGNSTYFLLTLLAMTDFFGGVAQRTRRRAAVIEAAPVPRNARRQIREPAQDPAVEPKLERVPAPQPAPAAPATSAQSVAESVLKDHPAPAPEISPQLQPSNTTSAPPDTQSR